jgi:ABC-type amino acid transport substrate-binding protein
MLGFWACLALCQQPRPRLRIGSGVDGPFAALGADGKPTGFLVEVLGEAARREGFEPEWIFQRLVERAILDDAVDVWAIAVPSEERRKTMYFSEPWWVEDHYVAVLEESPIRTIADLAGKRVAVRVRPPLTRGLATVFPNAVAVPVAASALLLQLCVGTADAALVSVRGLSQAPPPSAGPTRTFAGSRWTTS